MITIYLVTAVYSVAFLFGALGNLWVLIAMIQSKLCTPSNHRNYTPRERSRVFIFLLAIADFVVLMTVPFSLAQILQVRWIFGGFVSFFIPYLNFSQNLSIFQLCRFHSAVDFSGKFFSGKFFSGFFQRNSPSNETPSPTRFPPNET